MGSEGKTHWWARRRLSVPRGPVSSLEEEAIPRREAHAPLGPPVRFARAMACPGRPERPDARGGVKGAGWRAASGVLLSAREPSVVWRTMRTTPTPTRAGETRDGSFIITRAGITRDGSRLRGSAAAPVASIRLGNTAPAQQHSSAGSSFSNCAAAPPCWGGTAASMNWDSLSSDKNKAVAAAGWRATSGVLLSAREPSVVRHIMRTAPKLTRAGEKRDESPIITRAGITRNGSRLSGSAAALIASSRLGNAAPAQRHSSAGSSFSNCAAVPPCWGGTAASMNWDSRSSDKNKAVAAAGGASESNHGGGDGMLQIRADVLTSNTHVLMQANSSAAVSPPAMSGDGKKWKERLEALRGRAQVAAQLPGEQAAKSAKEKAQESARKKEQDAQDRAQIAESRRLDEAKKLEEITSAVEQLNLNPSLLRVCEQKAENPTIQRQIQACINYAKGEDRRLNGSEISGIVIEIFSAIARGQAIQGNNTLQLSMAVASGHDTSAILVLDQFAGDVVTAQDLKTAVQTEFPGTLVAANGGRQLGAGGNIATEAATATVSGARVKLPGGVYPASYMLDLSSMSLRFLEAARSAQPLKVLQCRTHLVQDSQTMSVLMTVAPDTAKRLHVLALQVTVLGGSTADLEAVLLHMIRTSMQNDLVADVIIPREMKPYNPNGRQATRGFPPSIPLQSRPNHDVFATGAPNALGAPFQRGGIHFVWLLATDAGAKQKLGTPEASITLKLGTGPVTLTPLSTTAPPRDEWGPAAAKKVVQQQAINAAAAPQQWIEQVLLRIAAHLQEDNEPSARALLSEPPMRPTAEMARTLHPVAVTHIRAAVEEWERLKAQARGRKEQAKDVWKEIHAAFTKALDKVKAIDMSVVPAFVHWHRTGGDTNIPDHMWRALLAIPQGCPESQMAKQLLKMLSETPSPPPVAGAALILSKPRTHDGKATVKGLSGGGTALAMVVFWASEIEAYRSVIGTTPEQPNTLKVEYVKGVYAIRVIFKLTSDEIQMATSQVSTQMIQEAIRSKLGPGCAIFIPNTMADGQANHLTGKITDCPMLHDQEKIFDIRATGFLQGLDPSDTNHMLMPILCDMISAEEIALVVSSMVEDEACTAYMRLPYARAIDLLDGNWGNVTYGKDISSWVIEQLQPSFMQEVRMAAVTGLWTAKDMVQNEYQRSEAGAVEAPAVPIDFSKLRSSVDHLKHPFAKDLTARRILRLMTREKSIAIVEVAEGGVILKLPEQQDLVGLIRDNQESLFDGIGSRIKYDAIVVTPSLFRTNSERLLRQVESMKINSFWLLAPADATSDFRSIAECHIRDQRSATAAVSPLVGEVMPDSIWSTQGPVFMAVVASLQEQGLAMAIQAAQLENGRQGFMVLLQLTNTPLQVMYGEDIEEDLKNANIKVGDNPTVQVMLHNAASAEMRNRVRKAVQAPQVLRGVQLTEPQLVITGNLTGPCIGGIDMMESLNLITKDELALASQAVEYLVRKKQVVVRNCMNGILILPSTDRLNTQTNMAERVAAWCPGTQELSALKDPDEGAPATTSEATEEMLEDTVPMEGVFNDMLKKLQTMKRDRSKEGSEMDRSNANSGLLAIKSATASEAFSEHFGAGNAIRDDGREWAIPAGSENSITYTLELDEPKEILGLGLAHRVEPRLKFFKQCYVQMPGRRASENKLTFTESREVQIAMLRERFISSSVEIKFPSDQISTGEGTPGLRGIMLIGCDPAEDGGKKRRT